MPLGMCLGAKRASPTLVFLIVYLRLNWNAPSRHFLTFNVTSWLCQDTCWMNCCIVSISLQWKAKKLFGGSVDQKVPLPIELLLNSWISCNEPHPHNSWVSSDTCAGTFSLNMWTLFFKIIIIVQIRSSIGFRGTVQQNLPLTLRKTGRYFIEFC